MKLFKISNPFKVFRTKLAALEIRINCLEGRHVWEVAGTNIWLSCWADMFRDEPRGMSKPGPVKCKHCYVSPPPAPVKKKRGAK